MEKTPRVPKPLFTRIWFWIALVVALVIYVLGWQITEIDLKVLVTDAHLIKPLIGDLLRPEVLERETADTTLRIDVQVPCPDEPPALPTASDIDAYVIPSTTCGEVGDTIQLEIANLPTNQKFEVWWQDSIGQQTLLGRFQADEAGTLNPKVEIPTEGGRAASYELQRIRVKYSAPGAKWIVTRTLRLTVDKMLETIFLALMATTFAIVIAIPVSFLGARNLMGRSKVGLVVYYITRSFLNILRAIEPLIWAIIFAVWVGIGPYAGVLALTLHSIAALGKLYSEAIESIDPGPIEAITATGANRLQTIVYAVVPQVVPPFISFTIYRWDINVRMSTVIGFVGGGGIGFLLIQWINLLQYQQAATAVWAIAIVVAAMDYISAIIREKLV